MMPLLRIALLSRALRLPEHWRRSSCFSPPQSACGRRRTDHALFERGDGQHRFIAHGSRDDRRRSPKAMSSSAASSATFRRPIAMAMARVSGSVSKSRRHARRTAMSRTVLEISATESAFASAIADVFIPPGPHHYVITYRTTRQIAFLADYDELYWNVTGNAWQFRDRQGDRHRAICPPARTSSKAAAYTGPQGAQGTDFRVVTEAPGLYEAETTRTATAGRRLHGRGCLSKGYADAAERVGRNRVPSFPTMPASSQSFSACSRCSSITSMPGMKVGRDPPKGVIVPLFAPPTGMGPAGVRYVVKQGFDDKAFAACARRPRGQGLAQDQGR